MQPFQHCSIEPSVMPRVASLHPSSLFYPCPNALVIVIFCLWTMLGLPASVRHRLWSLACDAADKIRTTRVFQRTQYAVSITNAAKRGLLLQVLRSGCKSDAHLSLSLFLSRPRSQLDPAPSLLSISLFAADGFRDVSGMSVHRSLRTSSFQRLYPSRGGSLVGGWVARKVERLLPVPDPPSYPTSEDRYQGAGVAVLSSQGSGVQYPLDEPT